MTKIVINSAVGGFGLSKKAIKLLIEKDPTGFKRIQEEFDDCSLDVHYLYYSYALERTDPLLIQAVEELGEEANGQYAKLKIVEVPDDIVWYLEESEYGSESVHEEHRIWY